MDGLMELLEAAGDRAGTAPPQAMECDTAFEGAQAFRFLTGGNATATFTSQRTQQRFTYRVRKSEDGSMFFVSVLTGADNESSYTYIGHIKASQNIFWHGRKSRIAADAPSVKGFAWAWQAIAAGRIPAGLTVWHAGKCGRCGRKLTVPQSIETGFGPECADRMGM